MIYLKRMPLEILWHFVKYLLAISFSLTVLFGVILALLYYKATAYIAPDIIAIALNTLANNAILIVGILFIPAIAGSLLLTNSTLRNKQLNEQLKLDERLLDIASDFIFVHDLDGNCIYSNKLTNVPSDYPKNELRVISLKARNFPEYAEIIQPKIKELVERGEATFEANHLNGDKSLIPVEVHSRIIVLGNRKFVLSAVRDITERKRTEEELRQSSERLGRAMEGTIQSLASTVEVRDPYTAGHQQRVSKLASAIAKEIGLSEEQIESIRVAGILHDVGKIYVPAEILSKPGHLRKNEFNLIKDHAEVGYDLLKMIEFSSPVAQIVFQHHERIDGSGYPQGLSGENILIEARIMGVADVVESMSSHRPYRPAFSKEKALLEIIQKKGTLYDPDVVDACIRLFESKNFKFD